MATRILAAVGMTPSEAVRLLFRRVVAEKRFPLELLVPDEATVAAMREQDLPAFVAVDDLIADLNADG